MLINKKILLITITMLFIAGLGIASAADTNDTGYTQTDTHTQATYNEQNTIKTEPTQKIITDNKTIKPQESAKNIQKIEKLNTKTAEKTVNSYSELCTEVNDAKTSTDSEYTINLAGDDGDYLLTSAITWGSSANVKTLTINGNGITINCDDSSFATIEKGHTLILNNIKIINGLTGADGNIVNKGNLTIINSIFKNNRATYSGVIFNQGNLNISHSTFEKNSAEEEGGVIRNYPNANINLTNSKFIQNKAKNGGCIGGIDINNVVINITNCEFDQNNASESGSVIILGDEDYKGPDRIKLYVENTTFTNNSAESRGTIYIAEMTATFKNCTFENNQAVIRGAAIFNYFSQYSFTDSKFINNTQTGEGDDYAGAAIYHYDNMYLATIDNCTFTNNNASGKKGGAAIYSYGMIDINNSIFNNNYAKTGEIICTQDTLSINNTSFSNNNARGGIIKNVDKLVVNNSNFTENEGGITAGIYSSSNCNVSNTRFVKNKGMNTGSIYIYSGNSIIQNSSFINNTAQACGGGITIHEADVLLNNSLFENNEATDPELGFGGAIAIEENSNVNITNSNFTKNKADYSSAISNEGTTNISFSKFYLNTGKYIGAIENNGNLYLYDSELSNNTAKDGGAISNAKTLTIENSNFTKNSAADNGGAVYSVPTSSIIIKNTNFTENNATNGGSVQILTNSYKLVGNTFRNNTPENFGLTTNQGRELIEIISTDGNTLNDDYDVTIQIDGTNAGSGTFNNGLMDDYPITETDCLYTFIMTGLYDDSKFRDNTYFYYPPLELSINTTNVTVEYGNTSFDIPVEFNKEVSAGTVRIKIDGSEIGNTTITEETKAVNVSVDITGLEINNYTFTAEYEQDTNLKNTTAILTITKVNTTTNIMEKNNVLGNASIKVNVTNKAGEIVESGFILVYDENNNFLGASPINGEAVTIPLNIKEKGTYTINVTYLGNDIYNPSNNTDTIKVIPETNIEIDILNNTEGNVIIKINATEKDGTPLKQQEVNITLPNGTKVTKKTDDNGIITITDTTTKPGNYTTTAAITTSDKYVGTTETDDLTIVPDYQSIIDAMNKTIQDQNKTIQDQNKTIQDQNKTIQDQNKTIQNQNKTIQEQNQTIREQNQTIRDQNQTIRDQNQTINDLNDTVQDLNKTVQEQKDIINDLQDKVSELNDEIDNLTKTLNQKDKTIQDQNKTIQDLNKTVQEQKDIINDLQDKVSELNDEIDNLTKTLNQKDKTIQDQNKTINDLNNKIKELNNTIKELNEEINLLQNEIDKLNELIDSWIKTTVIRAVPENNTVGETKVVVILDNKLENPITNAQITIKNKSGETIGIGKTDNKGIAVIPVDTLPGTENITAIYAGNNKYAANNTTVTITTYKINTTVTVDAVNGVIGESIKLTAHIKDANNNLVSGGNLVFKLNGKTLRTDGNFNSTAPAWKFKVNNGLVTITINADLYLRNAKNLTASYSGSYKYNEAKSDVVTAQIKKRDAKIAVTATPSKQKQYKTITFTAKLSDTTPNYKNKTMMHTGTKVLFKVNGKTIKDKNGANLLVKVNSNNTASYKYTVPQGMGGVTNDGKVRDYNVEAVLVSDIYYPDTRGTTTFNVERSPITIGISKVTVNSKNQLSVQASIKDYKNNYVIGTNNVNIKINGRSYVNAKTNKTQNFKVSDGKINLSKLQINKDIKIKSVMIVTGARQAYLGQRNETSKIVKV